MKFSGPKILLHLEGLAVLTVSLVLYGRSGQGWAWFAGALLVPDVALLAYLVNARLGSVCYNTVHTYSAPLLLLGVLMATKHLEFGWIVLVWTAHIGMDRFIGYGLRYPVEGKETHLSRV